MGVFKCWKTVEFLKISMKIRNCKTFSEPKRRATLRKSFCVTPNDPSLDKILLRLWNKISLTGIYRNIQTFAFKELEECSSWASRNGAVQMFFWHQTETCLLEKIFKSERLLSVLREHVIFNAKWVEVRKMSEVFWAKLYCKLSDLFC